MTTDQGGGEAFLPGGGRMLMLSDSVLAFALTLLVLQLKVPAKGFADVNSASELASRLARESGVLISYLISFFVIAQFWLAHHWVLHRLRGHHEGLAWLNFGFLFTITAMPFSSALVGNYGDNPLAMDIFAGNMLLASLAMQAMLIVGRRGEALAAEDPRYYRVARVRTMLIQIVIMASLLLAWVSTSLATGVWLLLAVAPAIARVWSRNGGSPQGGSHALQR